MDGLLRRLAAALALVGGSACHSYHPVLTTPAPGSRVVVDLSDEGRFRVRGLIGPEVARVEGALVAATDSAYGIRVSETFAITGARSRWSGEEVTLPRQYVRSVAERRPARGRTVIAVLGGLTAATAFIITRNLFGLGGGGDGPPGGGGEEQ